MKSFANLSNMTIMSAFLIGCATAPVQTPSDPATRLADLMAGTYAHRGTTEPLRDHRIRLDPLGSGEWLYHQINQGPALGQVYRQQVLSLRSRPDGRVTQTAYTITAPQSYQAMGNSLSALTRDQLQPEMDRGCDMIWIEMPNGWAGQVDPSRCLLVFATPQDERRMGARADLRDNKLRTAETGYDLDGNRVSGHEDGEWTVLNRSP